MATRAGVALASVRAVAAFEAAKGLLVVVAGLGLLALVHHDVQHAAEWLVRHMRLNPARQYPRIFIRAASRLDDHRLHVLAAGAFAYATVRFVEAYGLWRVRHWAEWMAIISTAIYMPVEILELVRRATAFRALVLVVNAVVLAALLYVRFRVPQEELELAEEGRAVPSP